MNLRVFNTAEDLAQAAAEWLAERVLAPQRAAVSLSGGTTPRRLYDILGGGEAARTLALQEIVWVLGDERCVPPDDPESNSRMIRETLFRNGMAPSHRFIDFRTELGEPEAVASAFEDEWRDAAIERLDCAVLGVGEDGHTASLFPDTPILQEEDRIAAAVWVERLGSARVSLTVPVIRSAASRMVLATGAGKREAVAAARRGEDLPIVRAGATDDHSWWFVDRDAYGEGS